MEVFANPTIELGPVEVFANPTIDLGPVEVFANPTIDSGPVEVFGSCFSGTCFRFGSFLGVGPISLYQNLK